MFRKGFAAAIAVLVLAIAAVSFAGTHSFTRFTLDVPEGWTTQEDGGVVALYAPGNAAAISIVMESADGVAAADIAKVMSGQLNGTPPVAENAGYSFTFKNAQGVASTSRVFVENNEFIMVTVTGEHPQAAGILQSIKEK